MNNLAVYLFGRPQFFVDGAEVSGFNKPEETARRNLRHALSQLQKVIGPGWIETAGGVGLSRRLPWSVDVQRLQAAVAGLSTPDGQERPALDRAHAAYATSWSLLQHVDDAAAADQYAGGNEPQCRDQFPPERPRAWSEADLADVRRNLVAGASVSAMKSIESTAITNNTKSTAAILHLLVKATAALPRVAIIVVGEQAEMYPRSLVIPVVCWHYTV